MALNQNKIQLPLSALSEGSFQYLKACWRVLLEELTVCHNSSLAEEGHEECGKLYRL